jgi:hypothetical protein
MKHIIALLFFIMLYPHNILFSMDIFEGLDYTADEGTELEFINLDENDENKTVLRAELIPIKIVQPTDSCETTIAQLYSTINRTYQSGYLPDFLAVKQLTEPQMITIIQMVPTDSPYATKIYNTLYDTNNFFAYAINYFINLAKMNLVMANMSNISTIENPEKQQPIALLNQLPLPIKTAVMEHALSATLDSDTYTITLDHGNPVHAFDICEATHCAATCNKEGNTHNFYLWDLQQGKKRHTFDEKQVVNTIAFSPDGTYVAAAFYNNNIIKIWNAQSHEKIYKLESTYTIERLAYSPATPQIPVALIVIQRTANDYKCITECALTTHTVPAGTCSRKMLSHEGRHQKYSFSGSVYNAKHPRLNSSNKNILHITKKCALLHFAQLAAKKPANQPLANNITLLEKSKTYQQLTDLEKTMAQETLRTNCLAIGK